MQAKTTKHELKFSLSVIANRGGSTYEVSVFLYGEYSAGLQKEIFCLNFRDKFMSHLRIPASEDEI